jgi:hypothetical protein
MRSELGRVPVGTGRPVLLRRHPSGRTRAVGPGMRGNCNRNSNAVLWFDLLRAFHARAYWPGQV